MSLSAIRMRLSFLIVLAAALTGCTNLGEIRQFAQTSSDAAGYSRLVDNYAASPQRMKRYTFANEEDVRIRLDEQTAKRAAQVDGLKAQQKAIEEYMGALGELASDKVPVYDKELTTLSDAAIKAKYVSASQASALTSLTSLVAEAATRGYQQREIGIVIERANSPLQNILKSMNSGVLKLFLENESLEEQMYDDYYRQILATANERAATGTREPREPAAAQLTRDVMADRKAEFGPRHQAISAYAEALDTIAAGHQRLYENRNKIDTKETLAMIKTYTKKIQATMKAINAAGW